MRLPVNPATFRVISEHGYNDIETAQLGEITVIGTRRLRGFSFESFFPRDYNPTYCEYAEIPDPETAVNTIERWQRSRRPARLTIAGSRDINVPVTIRRFEHEERGGQPGDIYYALELREYRFVQFERLAERTETAVKSVSIAKLRPDDREIPGQYTVRTGDYLIAIAARVYGDSSRWREIYDANRALIGPNPNVIQPGQTLVIPNG